MNISIPHQWLLDHLKTKAKPQEIQEFLSLSGPSVEKVEEIENDLVYDIEVTTNRVDNLSVRGIAREASVILNHYDLPAELKPLKLKESLKLTAKSLPLPVINNDPKLCQRIVCVVLSNVKQKATPRWMAKRLTQAGFQVHHSLIDITNYVTHDLGHPCHAFDYDKIMELGGVINITTAKPGRPFTTLDGVERETVGGEIIFTNEIGTIIDLPAIIGTANSAVNDQTKNILFWIESLDAQKVRQASINHAIRTIAAQLNEKNVDPYLAKDTLIKGVELYQKITNAKIASEVYDKFLEPKQVPAFITPGKTIEDYLDVDLPPAEVKQILSDLGCVVKIESDHKQPSLAQAVFHIQPPSFRPDLQIPADVIEEVARIYGYHNLPGKLMTGELPLNAPQETTFALEDRIRSFLSNRGWQEIYSLSLVSKKLANQTEFNLEQHLQLSNPLLTDNQYLRRSLVPSLQEAIASNPQEKNLSVFELAVVYQPQVNELPNQPMKLGLVSTNNYRQVRGELEALLKQFYLDEVEVVPLELETVKNSDFIKQTGEVNLLVAGKPKKIGQVSILYNNNIAVEIDCQELLKSAKKYPNYQPRWKTSPIIEELTFVLTPQTRVGEVIQLIQQTDKLITQVTLADIFQQNFTFQLQYQHPENNLTSEELLPLRKKIIDQVETEFQARLVGKI